MDDLRRQFEVNVHGTVAMIKAVLPHMRKRRSGRLLLGTDELRLVRAGRDTFEREMSAWAQLSASTDFDDISRSA